MVIKMKRINITRDNIIGLNLDYDSIKSLAKDYEDTIVICFENNFSEEKYYIKLLNESWVKKVILIGAKPTSCFGEKLIITNKLKDSFFKSAKRVFFIINTDIDEDVLIPIVQMSDIANKLGIFIGLDNILGFSYDVNSDLKVTLQALVQADIYKRYELVYDYICDELDKKFANNELCQFEDDRCIVNRKYYNKDKIMGCCYSFKYNGIQFSDIKLCEHQKDHKCDVKCLGCKLFTCDYLKKHGVRFSLENMPVALAFFSRKQREILRTTFFTSKNIILDKVLRHVKL